MPRHGWLEAVRAVCPACACLSFDLTRNVRQIIGICGWVVEWVGVGVCLPCAGSEASLLVG
jgi:hypothetical protein